MSKPFWTKGGFVTAAGLRAGEVQSVVIDDENYVMLSAGETHPHSRDMFIDVDVVRDGVTTNWNFSIGSINLARKRFSREAKAVLRRTPVLANSGQQGK